MSVFKATDKRSYINRVFLGFGTDQPEGKTAMHLALRVGQDVIRKRSIEYLDTELIDILFENPDRNSESLMSSGMV